MTMLFDNLLAHRAETCPDRLAVRAAGADLSYAELEDEARGAAQGLAAAGIRPGDSVALTGGPSADHVVLLHALAKLGAVVVPVGPRATGDEREELLRLTGASLAVRGLRELGAGADAAAELRGAHEPGAAWVRIATSGTTGEPRLVDLTHGNFLWSAVGTGLALGTGPGDRWLCCLPLHHVAGLSILTRAATLGIGAVVHEGFDPDRVARSLAEDGVTLVSLVATQLARLLEAGVDLTGPRALVLGGGPVRVELIEEAQASGATVVQTYGMTETCSQVTILTPAEARERAGSAGRPILGARVRSDRGEILVRGPVVAPGAAGGDGWLRTGDLGRVDEDGYLYVEGRADDLIVTGGENVQPAEVEAVLERHPDVAEAAVVGRPDPEWQQVVTAVVVPREGVSPSADALRAHCRTTLAPHKVPKGFELATALPRTPSGKLKRHRLRHPPAK